jgi:hypothetical protein
VFNQTASYVFHAERSRQDFMAFSNRQRAFDEVANRLCGRQPRSLPPTWRTQKLHHLQTQKTRILTTMEGIEQAQALETVQNKMTRANLYYIQKQPQRVPTFVAFGDGKCQTGVCARGAPKIPLLTLKRHLACHPSIKFGLVNEAYTSQVCSLHHQTNNQAHRVGGCHQPGQPAREVWAVRACQGCHDGRTTLPRVRYVNRDVNAARNILRLALSRARREPRPAEFTKPYWTQADRAKTMIPRLPTHS